MSSPPCYSMATAELGNDIPCRGQIRFSCSLSKWTDFQTCRIPQSPWVALQTAQQKGKCAFTHVSHQLFTISKSQKKKKIIAETMKLHWKMDHRNQQLQFPFSCSFSFSKRQFHKILTKFQKKIHPLAFQHNYLWWLHFRGNYFFFFFWSFWVALVAHGGSQARGPIGTVATGLHHSHSNATLDLSHICNLHHCPRQRQILNPPREARDRTHILMDASWVH